FGLLTLLMGLPCVFFFQEGIFDEYDYWAGTVSLVIFALLETIVFSWIFGINKGWREINEGSDITIPTIYKFIIKYITPAMLLLVFLGSLFTPLDNDWLGSINSFFAGQGWPLDNSSIIRQLTQSGLKEQISLATDAASIAALEDRIFYSNLARLQLVGLFLAIVLILYISFRKRRRGGRATL